MLLDALAKFVLPSLSGTKLGSIQNEIFFMVLFTYFSNQLRLFENLQKLLPQQ